MVGLPLPEGVGTHFRLRRARCTLRGMSERRRGPNHKPLHRATINEGADLAEVNRRLTLVGGRDIPQTSYDWVKRSYLPRLRDGSVLLGDWIEHPKPDGEM